jgi:hypothetical protein
VETHLFIWETKSSHDQSGPSEDESIYIYIYKILFKHVDDLTFRWAMHEIRWDICTRLQISMVGFSNVYWSSVPFRFCPRTQGLAPRLSHCHNNSQQPPSYRETIDATPSSSHESVQDGTLSMPQGPTQHIQGLKTHEWICSIVSLWGVANTHVVISTTIVIHTMYDHPHIVTNSSYDRSSRAKDSYSGIQTRKAAENK